MSNPSNPAQEIRHLRDLSPQQKRSGLAAWLGWLFDGLDMHLYTLVATAFVAQLLMTDEADPAVGQKASIIQAAFLAGWAFGGAFFGRVGDLLGRSRALSLSLDRAYDIRMATDNWLEIRTCIRASSRWSPR